MNVNSLLREGRELEEHHLAQAEELSNLGLCTMSQYQYVNCVDEQDDDFSILREWECSAKIMVDEEDEQITCPECDRTIYLAEKNIHNGYRLHLDHSGLREFVRDICKEHRDRSVRKRSNPLTYLNYDFDEVNEAEVGADKLLIPIVTRVFPKQILDSIRVVDRDVLWILVGEAIPMSGQMDKLGIHHFTIGELLTPSRGDAGRLMDRKLQNIHEESSFQYIDLAAQSALNLCSSNSTLELMGWAEFEHCVHTLLQYSLQTSYILGETERGSGYPDGALTLHWSDSDSLFMWDAKFVNLRKKDETELSGEYDKIFRHLREMDGYEQFQREFGGVAGILLFSPGIKKSNIRRLVEFIQEQQITDPTKWNGSVVYIELEALVELAKAVRENRSDVRHKPNWFRKTLHTFLTNTSKHDDPEIIQSVDYPSIHMGTEDISDIFAFLDSQSSEHHEFNREAFIRAHKFFHEA